MQFVLYSVGVCVCVQLILGLPGRCFVRRSTLRKWQYGAVCVAQYQHEIQSFMNSILQAMCNKDIPSGWRRFLNLRERPSASVSVLVPSRNISTSLEEHIALVKMIHFRSCIQHCHSFAPMLSQHTTRQEIQATFDYMGLSASPTTIP